MYGRGVGPLGDRPLRPGVLVQALLPVRGRVVGLGSAVLKKNV